MKKIYEEIAKIIIDDYSNGLFDIDACLNKKEIFNNVVRIMGNRNKKLPDSFKINDDTYTTKSSEGDGVQSFICKRNNATQIFQISIEQTS